VNTLALNKSGGDTFLSEADALNAQGTTPGNLTLDAGAMTVNAAGLSAAGGALTASALTLNGALNLGVGSVTVNGPASGAGLLTADTLNLNGGGNVGVNAGNRLNTVVNTLALNKSGGDTFLSEADGLSLSGVTGGGNFDLVDAGLTTLIGSVNAGRAAWRWAGRWTTRAATR